MYQYLLSIGKGNNKYAELYDLDNLETKSQILAITFLDSNNINNIRGSGINYKINNDNYFIYPFIDKETSEYSTLIYTFKLKQEVTK